MNQLLRSRLSSIALILLIPMALVGCDGMTCEQCVVACAKPCMESGTIVGLLACTALAEYTCAIPICGYDPICQCKGVDPCDEVVDFPDTNLKQAMLELTCRFEGDICVAHLISLDDISVVPASISDLTGLEYCTELHSLNLNENQISNVSPLVGLIYLRWLHLDGNQISDLSPLAGLTDLLRLGLSNNQISDISPLAGLTSLMSLHLDGNQISDILPLVNNPGIDSGDEVHLEGNPLSATSCTVHIPELEDRRVIVHHDCP